MRTKYAIRTAFDAAIKAQALDCEALGDGIGVRMPDGLSFEPDCMVYCGSRLADTDQFCPNPMIIVEVLSPSTKGIDVTTKLEHYFKLASVRHCLIVDADARAVVHHRRTGGETIETRIVREGQLALDPPGLVVPVLALFAAE